MREQVCDEDLRQGLLPFEGPRTSLPCPPNQQDVVMRWCRSVSAQVNLDSAIHDPKFSLQTGMRGAWGKPYGTVARVNIGQVILSIRTKESNAAVVNEALRRARYKFPGRQKIITSRKWGFTKVNREDYLKLKEEKRVLQYVVIHVAHHQP